MDMNLGEQRRQCSLANFRVQVFDSHLPSSETECALIPITDRMPITQIFVHII